MSLKSATTALLRLRDALAAELRQSIEERRFLGVMDTPRILRRAGERVAFNLLAEELQREYLGELTRMSHARQLLQPSVSGLAESEPGPDADLLVALQSEVQQLAETLRATQEQNRALAERALAIVSGHLAALSPKPAYDRHGRNPAARAGSTVSTRV